MEQIPSTQTVGLEDDRMVQHNRRIPVLHFAAGLGGAELVFAYALKAVVLAGFSPLAVVAGPAADRVLGFVREVIGPHIKFNVIKPFGRYVFPFAYRLQNITYSVLLRQVVDNVSRGDAALCINTKANEMPIARCSRAQNLLYLQSIGEISRRTCWMLSDRKSPSCLLSDILGRQLLEAYRRGDIVIANSEFTARLVREELGFYPLVVYPPVNISEFASCTAKAKRNLVLCVGRITPSKRLEVCIGVLARIKDEAKLAIVGYLDNHRYLEALIAYARSLGVRDRVFFLPNVPRSLLRELYCSAKVLLHTNCSEPFGITVVEAMAAGAIPVVCGGGPAYIVPRKFHYKTLEEAADRVVEALEAPDSVRTYMRKLAERFSAERFVERMANIILRAAT